MFARLHYVDGTTTVPREVVVKNIYFTANRREEKKKKKCEPKSRKQFVVFNWSHSGCSICTSDERHWSQWQAVYDDVLYVLNALCPAFCAYLRFIFHYRNVFFSFPSLGSPSSSSIFSLVIYFLLASCIIPFAEASGEPCAPPLPPSLRLSIPPSSQWIRVVTPSSMLIGFMQTEHDHWTASNYNNTGSLTYLWWHVF